MHNQKKIDRLTDEQIARAPEFVAQWTAIGLSCEPLDLERAKIAVNQAYAAAGVTSPQLFVVCDSPVSAAITRHVLSSAGDSAQDSVWNSVQNSVRNGVWTSAWDSIDNMCFGSHDAGWLGFYDFFREVGGLTQQTEKLLGLTELAKCCGWWAPYQGCAILQHRHSELRRDEVGRLHNPAGMAVRYRDGWGVYAIHGHQVPGWIIEEPASITVEKIKSESNVETKRIMREIYGEGRYLADTGARVVDTDLSSTHTRRSRPSQIMRALIEDAEGRKFLVGTE